MHWKLKAGVCGLVIVLQTLGAESEARLAGAGSISLWLGLLALVEGGGSEFTHW